MKKSSLVIMTLICCLGSCRFDDFIVEKPYLPMPEAMNAYFNVPTEGSLYIFKDSISGILDTTFITSRDLVLSPGPDYVGESFYIQYESGRTRKLHFDLRSSDKRVSLRIISPPSSGRSDLTWDKEQKSYTYLPTCHQQLDSVVLDGQVYYDVFEFLCAPYYQKMWFAKGIGLIMKEPTTVISGEHHYYRLIDFQKK